MSTSPSLRDRFFTRPVGRALVSPWRLLIGAAAGALAAAVGVSWPLAALIGVAAYAITVATAMPRRTRRARVDPFTLSEPWRSHVQRAQSAALRFDRAIAGMTAGPIRDRMRTVSARLDDAIEQAWQVANRGDDIDAALAQLNTTRATTELERLRASADDNADVVSTIRSLESQLESATRMQTASQSTRTRLALLDARFDELVARAAEVKVGVGDSNLLGNDVDDLVHELEGLRLALVDLRPST